MSAVIGEELGPRLCEALGIPVANLNRIIIDVQAGHVVTLTATYYHPADGDLLEVFQDYELHAKED